jgi:NAD dependent epimerase/dehydratase
MDLTNKKVLVTGADGFIGSHLVEGLLEEGCKVKAFIYYNSFNNWGWLDSFPKEKLSQIEIFAGDIRDPNGVRTAMKDVDIVFHLAALIAIPFSYHSPDNYVDTNIKGTLNVLQAARDFNTEKILVTSTSEVYGTGLYVPIDEKHPRQGQSPYSATKIGADSISESFYRSFNLPVTIVRPFNTFGPRQSARAVIPTIIIQLLNGKKEVKLGAVHPTRDLLYVKDTAAGFIEIAKSDQVNSEEINIATQQEISVGDLAQKLINIINPSARIVSDEKRKRPEKSEVERLLGSN